MKASLTVFGIFIAFLLGVFVTASYHVGGDEGVITRVPAASEQSEVSEEQIAEPKAAAFESPEEKLARMLRAFDGRSFRKGMLVISFAEGTTKEEARAVIERYSFTFGMDRVCGPEISEQPKQSRCAEEEQWNERLKIATVTHVPVGEEKTYAERLIRESSVIWVEPELITTAAQETTEPEGTPVALEQETKMQEPQGGASIAFVLGIILVILLVLYFLFHKKKTFA